MNGKSEALAQIVALAQAHQLSLDDIQSALGRPQIEANKKNAGTLTRLFSYLGGIFIFAGLSAFVGMNWDDLNTTARILVSLGTGMVCLIIAAVAAKRQEADRKVSVLIILSALLQPTGLFVTAYEFSTGSGDVRLLALLIFAVLSAQYGLFFWALRRTTPLFFAIYFGFSAFVALGLLVEFDYDFIMFICGASLVALSYGIQRTPYNSICGFGYFIGSILLLWLGFDLLKNTPIELLYLGVACFMLYVSTIVASRSVLITSTLAILSYISYFTQKNFLDSIGWPIALILLGFIFFGVGSLAIRLNRQIKAET
jgi:hypothetical protein